MHEFSLLADLMRKIDNIAREQKVDKVLVVKVKLGALSHISAEHFREHFVHSAKGTVAEGAQLDVEVLTDTEDPNAQEIILDSIEVAEE